MAFPSFTSFNHSQDDAINALLDGKCVSRMGLTNGSFIFKQVAAEVPVAVIEKMSSLPPSAKGELLRRGKPLLYQNQFCYVDGEGSVLTGWFPPKENDGVRDWIIYHDKPELKSAPVEETVGTAIPVKA